MTPTSANRLLTAVPAFAIATPIFTRDQDAPAPKPQDKPKPKGKPAKDRKLSDFETEAIKRIARLDPGLAGKLRAKLPKKKKAKEQAAYVRKRIGKLDGARKLVRDLNKDGFAGKDGLEKGLKRIAEIETELGFLEAFFKTGRFPEWYKKLLKKREKAKQKNQGPTTKPAPAMPMPRPNGLLISFIAEDGAATL